MKRTLVLLSLVGLIMLFAACGNGGTTQTSTPQTSTPQTEVSDEAVEYWVSLSYASFDEDSTDFFKDANFDGYALNIKADGSAEFSGYKDGEFMSCEFLWQSSGENTYLLGLKQSDGSMDEDAVTFSLATEEKIEDKILMMDMFGEELMFANVGENRYNGVVDFLKQMAR